MVCRHEIYVIFLCVHSFELFVKLFLAMTVAWLFLLLSWLHYPAVIYCHIIMNVLLALMFLYICVLGQQRVMFLLRQACCCCQQSEPADTVEWGEEMSSMNTAIYWVDMTLLCMCLLEAALWMLFVQYRHKIYYYSNFVSISEIFFNFWWMGFSIHLIFYNLYSGHTIDL